MHESTQAPHKRQGINGTIPHVPLPDPKKLRREREQRERAKNGGTAEAPEPNKFGRLRILSVEDALNAPPRTYLLEGLLAPGELSVFWGKPKCGKSFLMMRLAYGQSQGTGMWDREAVRVPVLYVAAEGEGGVKGRVRALHDALGPAPNFHLIAQSVDLFDQEADLSDLIGAAKALGVRLLVLDTLARVMGAGDENSTRDMNTFVRNCDRIREETKAHVAVVHHGGWDGSHARGSIALIGAADLVVKVDGEQGCPRAARVEYAKDDEGGDALGFELEVRDLPPDAKGKPRTTCLAVATSAPADAVDAGKGKGKELTAEEQGWLKDLQDFFHDPRQGHELVRPDPDMPVVRAATRDRVRAWLQRRGRIGGVAPVAPIVTPQGATGCNGGAQAGTEQQAMADGVAPSVAPSDGLSATDRSRLFRYISRLKDKGKLSVLDGWIWLL